VLILNAKVAERFASDVFFNQQSAIRIQQWLVLNWKD
jgi:hypothetical protein